MNLKLPDIDHDLLMLFLTGEADDLRKEEVKAWLNVSDEHAAYLKSLELMWIETGKLNPPPVPVDTGKAWEKIAHTLNLETEIKTVPFSFEKIRPYKFLFRVAAIIVLLFGIFGIYKVITYPDKIHSLASTDQIITDTLNDGSVISLNKNSKLEYPAKFSKQNRILKLEGEAFFEVKHDKKRPFIVELEGVEVEVMGTSFNINEIKKENTVEVYVKTGTVKVTGITDGEASSSILLNAGEKGRVDTKTGKVEKTLDIGMNEVDVSWLNQTFVFDGVRLEDVARFLEGYYYVKIVFAQEDLRDLRLTATFKNDKIDDMMQVIADSFGLLLTKDNTIYTLDETGR